MFRKICNVISFILICSCFLCCKKKEKTVTPIVKIPSSKEANTQTDPHIKDFIWSCMNRNYLWVDNIPSLADNRFSSNDEKLVFLNSYNNYQTLFDALLYQKGVVDKWSYLVDDYMKLEKEIKGVNISMGYEYRLYQYSNSDNIFGIVMYVVKDSPAYRAGVKRGDIFVEVNDIGLSRSNYKNLLIDNQSYTLSFAYIDDNVIIPSGKKVSLSAIEIFENPIFLDTIYTAENQKVGYLVYNSFVADYDNTLNQVFAKFKNQNVNQLILDLRYNSGGQLRSAKNLASMIFSDDTNKVFMYTHYNKKLDCYYIQKYGKEYSTLKFSNLTSGDGGVSINTLNLKKLYVITSNSTASASELIINCLKPYLEVVIIGSTTKGKNVGSVIMKDYDTLGKINLNHKWAVQAIVSKSANVDGFSGYESGFDPNIEMYESIVTLSSLGNLNEPLLNTVMAQISGNLSGTQSSRMATSEFKSFGFSKDFGQHSDQFIMDEVNIKHK